MGSIDLGVYDGQNGRCQLYYQIRYQKRRIEIPKIYMIYKTIQAIIRL